MNFSFIVHSGFETNEDSEDILNDWTSSLLHVQRALFWYVLSKLIIMVKHNKALSIVWRIFNLWLNTGCSHSRSASKTRYFTDTFPTGNYLVADTSDFSEQTSHEDRCQTCLILSKKLLVISSTVINEVLWFSSKPMFNDAIDSVFGRRSL